MDGIPTEDKILILTSRTDEYREMTMDFLKKSGIRYDEIMFNIPAIPLLLVCPMATKRCAR